MRSRSPSTRLILLMIVLLLAPALCAAQGTSNTANGPYSATVPVPDSSAAQRNHAFEVALTQVLTRTAGQDLSQQPGYGSALGKASDYVQQYQYKKDAQGSGYSLQVSFDAAAVHALIRRMSSAPTPPSGAGQAAPAIGGSGTLWVGGIHSADDMARLIAALRDNAQVVSVHPAQASSRGLLLRVNARVSMNALTQSLISQGMLAPDSSAHAGADASARWVH